MSSPEVYINKQTEAVYDCVCRLLSEDDNVRKVAEEQIRTMEIVPEYSVYLLEITLHQETTFDIRHMAVILLKRYLMRHWPYSDDSANSIDALDPGIKIQIRKLLPDGLKDPDKIIRSMFSYIYAFVVCRDWPNHWAAFSDVFNELVARNSEEGLLGLMQAYQDITLEVQVEDEPFLIPVLLETVCGIIKDEAKYAMNVRIEALVSLHMVFSCISNENETTKEFIIPKLPSLFETFLKNLQSASDSTDDYGYKTNVFRFLALLMNEFPEHMAPFITAALPAVWNLVVTYGDFYKNYALLNQVKNLMDQDDDDGYLFGFSTLVLSIFDFIYSIVDCQKLSKMLHDVLSDIMYYLMIFMLITKHMEDDWNTNIVHYITDDDDEGYNAIRLTSRQVLMLILRDFEEHLVVPALCEALNRHMTECRHAQENDLHLWWKIHEVCCFTLGLSRDVVIAHYQKAGNLEFDLRSYISHWQYMPSNTPKYLAGCCLWLAARYSRMINAETYTNYINMTINFLRTKDSVLQICAIRTAIVLSEKYEENPNLHVLKHFFPSLVNALIDILSAPQTHYFLVHTLKTVNMYLAIDKQLTESVEEKMISLTISIFMKHNHNPDIMKQLLLIIKEYCLICNCTSKVQDKLVPVLVGILNSPKDKTASSIQVVTMDFLHSITKFSKHPVNEILVLVAFPNVIKTIMKTDDHHLMQSGAECLCNLILFGSEKLFSYSDGEGRSGLDYILDAVNRLLDPAFPKNACKRIGKLLITLMNKAGPVLENHIHMLLRSVLSRMQRAEDIEQWQSLLIVFAYLFCTEVEAVVQFLTSIPGPTGASALQFVLEEWLLREHLFSGLYEHMISTIGLSKLLEYAVTSQDTCFDTIMVRDEIRNVATGEVSMIPVLIRVFKVVAKTFSFYLEKRQEAENMCPILASSYYDLDNDDFLSDNDSDDSEGEHDHHDPFSQDPILHTSLIHFLTEFMNKFKMLPTFERFYSALDEREKDILVSFNFNM